MPSAYDHAVETLYRAPLAAFVSERTRLAADLRSAGEKAAAIALAKRRRPTIAAWAVNQLYWHARDAFDHLLAAATRVRTGDLDATADHRAAIARLRKRAAAILGDAGHGATEETLRRVTTTLTAIAALGGFGPDPPGALAADRDPPGFEAMELPLTPLARAKPTPGARADRRAPNAPDPEEERRAAEQEQRRRREAEAARRKAERHRAETRLRTARAELERRERALSALETDVRAAEGALAQARHRVEQLQRDLDELEDTDGADNRW